MSCGSRCCVAHLARLERLLLPRWPGVASMRPNPDCWSGSDAGFEFFSLQVLPRFPFSIYREKADCGPLRAAGECFSMDCAKQATPALSARIKRMRLDGNQRFGLG